MQHIYKEYADLKGEIKALELREAELKATILEDLKKQNLSKIEGEFGSITVVVKRSFKNTSYSKKLQKAIEDIEMKKVDEQEKGVAKPTESEYIKYTPVTE